MNTNHALPLSSSASPLALAIDRRIWLVQAVFMILVVLAGFVPDSVEEVGGILAGKRPPFPWVAHAHALSMGAFLLFLLAQATLMTTQRRALHMRLGPLALLLVPVMVAAGFALAVDNYRSWWDFVQNAAPEAREKLQQGVLRRDNILLVQLRAGLLFPLCIWIALRARKTDPGLHKRMMFLATAVPMPAAFARIDTLLTGQPPGPVLLSCYALAAVAPMLLWDLARNRTLHKAYWIWLALFLPASAVVYVLWDTPWWHAAAQWLMGV